MFIKLGKIVIALSMLIISLSTWRYQGDVHHLHQKLFTSKQQHTAQEYQQLWQSYAKNQEPKRMQPLYFWTVITRFIQPTAVHPSELMMDQMIQSPSWKPNIPNSNSSTYPLSQKIWMSQNLTLEQVMDYLLDHNISVTSPPPFASHSTPNR